MQLIHLTYTWKSNDTATNKRIDEASVTWLRHADPHVYTAMELRPDDMSFTAELIGDRLPYPILNILIDMAFHRRRNDQTVVLFTNSDIRLRPGCWPIVEKRTAMQVPHYEDCIHTRKQKPNEAQSDPVTFFFTWPWWTENKIFIPPVLFACPWWEPFYQSAIDRTHPDRLKLEQCTDHVPHTFFDPFRNWRDPGPMYNHALSEGWMKLRFDLPHLGRGLKLKRKENPFSLGQTKV